MRLSKPTKFSDRVRKLLIPIAEGMLSDEFDPDKLKYGFVYRIGSDPNTGYISVYYFYYLTDVQSGRYLVFDVGLETPQNSLRGALSIISGCTQCTYQIVGSYYK